MSSLIVLSLSQAHREAPQQHTILRYCFLPLTLCFSSPRFMYFPHSASALQWATDPICNAVWLLVTHNLESLTTSFAAFLFSNPHNTSLTYENILCRGACIVLAEASREKVMVFSPHHKQTAQREQEIPGGVNLQQEVTLLVFMRRPVSICIWGIALSFCWLF